MRLLFHRRHRLVYAAAFAFVALTATLALAGPGTVACGLVYTGGLAALPDGTLVELGRSTQDQAVLQRLLTEGRSRIAHTFGPPRAQPVVVFLQDAHLHGLSLNSYGSTSFIGSRACVFIGPQGYNPDVVAHELVHAEVFARVGYWRRLLQIPTWFDEGLAMQVDRRPAYELPADGSIVTSFVRRLDTGRAFNAASDDAQLTYHYAAAKAEVNHWLAKVGTNTVYARLDRLREGEKLSAIWEK